MAAAVSDRERIIKEIFDSEVTYVRFLHAFDLFFLKSQAFRQSKIGLPFASKAEYDSSFIPSLQRKVAVILDINNGLIHALGKAVGLTPDAIDSVISVTEDDASDNTSGNDGAARTVEIWRGVRQDADLGTEMANVFLATAGQIALYSDYVNHYNAFLLAIDAVAAESEEFIYLLKQCKNRAFGLDANSFLIMPIQRVPRYVILLRELLKKTDESSDSHAIITAALASIAEVADKVNHKQRQHERLAKLMELTRRIEGLKYPLVMPHRRFVKESDMLVWCNEEDVSTNTDLMASGPSGGRTRPGADRKYSKNIIRPGTGALGSNVGEGAAWRMKRVFLFSDLILICKPKSTRKFLGMSTGTDGSVDERNSFDGGSESATGTGVFRVETSQFLRYTLLGLPLDVDPAIPRKEYVVVVERADKAPILLSMTSVKSFREWKDVLKHHIVKQSSFSAVNRADLVKEKAEGAENTEDVSIASHPILSPEDLGVLFANSTTNTYDRDKIILDVGAQNQYLYRVAHGFVRVERPDRTSSENVNEEKSFMLKRGGEGYFFGHLYFVGAQRAMARIVADVDRTRVQKVHVSLLSLLLRVEPHLNAAFHYRVAADVATHLLDMPAGEMHRIASQTRDEVEAKRRQHVLARTGGSFTLGKAAGKSCIPHPGGSVLKKSNKLKNSSQESGIKYGATPSGAVGGPSAHLGNCAVGGSGDNLVNEFNCEWDRTTGNMLVFQSGLMFVVKRFGMAKKKRIAFVMMFQAPEQNGSKVTVFYVDEKHHKKKVVVGMNIEDEGQRFCKLIGTLAHNEVEETNSLLAPSGNGGSTENLAPPGGAPPSAAAIAAVGGGGGPPPRRRGGSRIRGARMTVYGGAAGGDGGGGGVGNRATMYVGGDDVVNTGLPTPEDWNVIWDNSHELTVEAGAFILHEGKQSNRWFQIMKGTVSVMQSPHRKSLMNNSKARIAREKQNAQSFAQLLGVKDDPSRRVAVARTLACGKAGNQDANDDEDDASKEKDKITVATLGVGSVFGEMSFLLDTPACADIVADCEVSLRIVDAPLLHRICDFKTGLAARLYKHLGIIVMERLVSKADTVYGMVPA